MSNSNYSFRAAFKEVKGKKRYQRETEVDDFLKSIISEIDNDSNDEIYEGMLNEILFLQTEEDECEIEVYLKNPFPGDEDEEFPYIYLTNKVCDDFCEACNMLELLSTKLKAEDFFIKPYNGENALENGKSFILTDNPR